MHTKTDSQIKHDVLEELKWDTRVDGRDLRPAGSAAEGRRGPLDETEVGVQVHHGIVTLTGTVTSWAKRIAARDAAHRVAGVRDVADELSVQLDAPTRPSDSEIAEAVRNALKWHALVPERRIQTTVSSGIVTLSGSVDYASQREDAARAVGQIDGVCGVNNEIKLAAPSVSPPTLRAAIERALERHATREAKHIQLDIEGSKVTVSGPVDSLTERLAIVGAVWGTRGVDAVIDRTRIG